MIPPVRFAGPGFWLAPTRPGLVGGQIRFGDIHELRRRRLTELLDQMERDLDEGRIQTKRLLGSEEALLDINGREYRMVAGKTSWSLQHEAKTDTSRTHRLGFMQFTRRSHEVRGIELSLARKFFSDGYRLEYRDYNQASSEATPRYNVFITDESPEMRDRAWAFFQKLTRHVFTDAALKPFVPDKLRY